MWTKNLVAKSHSPKTNMLHKFKKIHKKFTRQKQDRRLPPQCKERDKEATNNLHHKQNIQRYHRRDQCYPNTVLSKAVHCYQSAGNLTYTLSLMFHHWVIPVVFIPDLYSKVVCETVTRVDCHNLTISVSCVPQTCVISSGSSSRNKTYLR